MRSILIFMFLFLTTIARAQDTLYYNNGELSTREHATNYRVFQPEVNGRMDFADYFMNGQVHIRASTLNDKAHGSFITYYINGQMESDTEYDEGTQVGVWSLYYQNGAIKRKEYFKKGKEEVIRVEYFDSLTRLKTHEGQFINVDSLTETGRTVKTKKSVGAWKMYRAGTSLVHSEYHYRNNVFDGSYKEYDSVGNLIAKGQYREGFRTGLWMTIYNGTNIIASKVNYENGQYQGKAFYYDTAGRRYRDGYYVAGKRDGVWKTYTVTTGDVQSSEQYENGLLNGIKTMYTPEGHRSEVMSFKNGRKFGIWTVYYPDIQKTWFECNMRNDTVVGVLSSYYRNGQPRREEVYKRGKLVAAKCYDEHGAQIPFYPMLIPPEPMLENYIANCLRYPQAALDAKTEGTVYLGLVIDPQGSVEDAEVLQGIGNGCEEEAVRVVKNMPPWRPLFIDGIAVRSYISIPVLFTLPENRK